MASNSQKQFFQEELSILNLPQDVLLQILLHFSLKDIIFRLDKVCRRFRYTAHCICAYEKKFDFPEVMKWFRNADRLRAAIDFVAPRIAAYVETVNFGDVVFHRSVSQKIANFPRVKNVQVSIWFSFGGNFACNVLREACSGAENLKITRFIGGEAEESGVVALAQELPNLKVLDLSDKTFSLEEFVSLKSKLPETLDIQAKDVQCSASARGILVHTDWITRLKIHGLHEWSNLPLMLGGSEPWNTFCSAGSVSKLVTNFVSLKKLDISGHDGDFSLLIGVPKLVSLGIDHFRFSEENLMNLLNAFAKVDKTQLHLDLKVYEFALRCLLVLINIGELIRAGKMARKSITLSNIKLDENTKCLMPYRKLGRKWSSKFEVYFSHES